MGYDWHATTLPTVCCECLCLYLWLGGTACVAIAWKLTFNHIHITTSADWFGQQWNSCGAQNCNLWLRSVLQNFNANKSTISEKEVEECVLLPLLSVLYCVTRASWAFPNLWLKAKGAHNVVNWSSGASSLLKGELNDVQGSHFWDCLRNCAHQNMLLITRCLGGIFATFCKFSKNVRVFNRCLWRYASFWLRFWTRCLHTLSTSHALLLCPKDPHAGHYTRKVGRFWGLGDD